MAKQTLSARIDQGALNDLLKKFDKAGDDIRAAVADELAMAAILTESDAKINLTNNKSVITGRLRASIISIIDRDKLSAVVGTNVEYAKAVEFGAAGRMAKPYLYPAFFDNASKLMKNLEKILEKI